jgi:hypothetical protein
MNRRRVTLLALPLLLSACATAVDSASDSTDDALSLQNFTDLLRNKVDRSAPDPTNQWSDPNLALGEENFLGGEDAMFDEFATTVNDMQRATAKDGAVDRGFHAKPHACVLGEMTVYDGVLPADQSVGLFAKAATYPTYVRFSNGVGYRQADKKVDVRGLAFKVMNVPGKKLGFSEEDASTQDFLMTNGPITPACDSKHFVDFGAAMARAKEGSSILGRLENMSKAGGFLLKDENIRTLDFLIHRSLPNTKDVGSALGDQFWSGGAIALGLEDGPDVLHAKAKRAIKFTAIPGKYVQGVCQHGDPGSPNTGDDNYFRTDLKNALAAGDICADFMIQFQEDPVKQPIEDTSVEWTTPFQTVAMVVVHQQDIDSDDAKAREAQCNTYGFTPWHSLPDHRPLGNIMRARRAVYSASASLRGSTPDPKQ